MANLCPKSEKAEQSFNAIYSAIQTKGGTGATQNIINTYKNGIESIPINPDVENWYLSQSAGNLNTIFPSVTISTGSVLGNTTEGFCGGSLFSVLTINDNITDIYAIGDKNLDMFSVVRLKILGNATLHENCFDKGVFWNELTANSKAIDVNLGTIYARMPNTTINFPKLQTFKGQLKVEKVTSTDNGKFGEMYQLNRIDGIDENGGFSGMQGVNTVFTALTEINNTAFCKCYGTIILPGIRTLESYNQTTCFCEQCSFDKIWFGDYLQTVTDNNIQKIKDMQAGGTVIATSTYAGTQTKTIFDNNGITYVQEAPPS